MKEYKAIPMMDLGLSLGESPFFDARTNYLSFVDINNGTLFVIDAGKFEEGPVEDPERFIVKKLEIGQPLGTAMPMAKEGEYLLCATDGLYYTDEGAVKLLRETKDIYESFQRSNDAKCDPEGRLFFGSSVYESGHGDSGNLFCLDKGRVIVLEPNTGISNGLAWSGDCKKFYYIDSPCNAVFEYDYDVKTGSISGRRKLAHVENSVPDGMCIDSEDNLWVAVWGGRRIEHISTKTGEVLGIVEVDATNVTSCCFFGREMNKLFITTSGDGNDGEHDGSVFMCQVDAKGADTVYFEV